MEIIAAREEHKMKMQELTAKAQYNVLSAQLRERQLRSKAVDK